MTATALTAAAVARVTNDKPILVGANALESVTTMKWLTGATDNVTTATSLTDSSYPVTRAYDRHLHATTRPQTSTTASTWYLCFDINATKSFDMIMIGGHNFTSATSLTVSFEIADSATYNSNLHELASWSNAHASSKRLVSLSLKHTGSDPFSYSIDTSTPYARYGRLKLAAGANWTPQIGEIWLGTRRHLPYQFDGPLDDKSTESVVSDFEARSGARTRYVFSEGRARRAVSTLVDAAADITTVDNFWSDCGHGSKPFLMLDQPSTDAQRCYLMTHQGGLDFPLVLPAARQLSLNMVEHAPYYTSES